MSEHTNEQTSSDEWTEKATGDGGPMGVPSTEGHGMPAGGEVEEGAVVSGGGVVDRGDIDPDDEAESMTDVD
jgi:hypothetical protein